MAEAATDLKNTASMMELTAYRCDGWKAMMISGVDTDADLNNRGVLDIVDGRGGVCGHRPE
jgi:hypothetical protein